MPEPHRFGVIALSGPPNAGKSTLLNRIIGEKISIMSRRAQTTRHRILGIKTLAAAQLVFVDTPGLQHRPPKGLNRVINRTALNSLADVDLILFMIDGRGWTPELEQLFAQVARAGRVAGAGAAGGANANGDGGTNVNADSNGAPVILLINKIDRLKDRARLLPIIKHSAELHPFKQIIPISARKFSDVDNFLNLIAAELPEGGPGFPADQFTDRSQRFLAAELVREQTLNLLGHELPYASAVEVTRFEYRGDNLLHVAVIVWVEKTSQKSIVIGRGGRQLKAIGQAARKQMEKAFGVQVYLEPWVKVKSGWAGNAAMLRTLGYLEEERA